MARDIIFICLLLFLAVCAKSPAEESVNVHVRVEGFRSKKGICNMLLFRDKKGFPDSSPHAEVVLQETITGNSVEFKFNTRPGKYAISVLHDENLNEKMDKTWYGKPVEGFGVSNNSPVGAGPPGFNESALFIDNKNSYVQINMIYLKE